MFYFIAWTVFLLLCIIAVPVANAREKKRRQALAGPPEVQEEATFEDTAEGSGDEEGFGEDEFGQAEEFDAPGGDDFSAFDEEFK